MNIQPRNPVDTPERDEARAALDVLRRWASAASPTEVAEFVAGASATPIAPGPCLRDG